jgi:CheY-like chemotaxis protein
MQQNPPRRIVVADDNEDSAQSFAMLPGFPDTKCATVRDGEQAPAVRDFRPDVAFLDIGMPRLSGYEVAEAVRAEPWGRDVKLIAVTGWGQADDKVRARSAGFDQHLVKPIDPSDVDRLLEV